MAAKQNSECGSSSSSDKRRQTDLTNLMMKDYKVELVDDQINEFDVEFHGPANSPYRGYFWTVRVVLADDYPFSPPVLRFVNEIYHPNISVNGVCLDILKERWTPGIDLVSIFDLYLPQLLMDPNPLDPINLEAAIFFTTGEEAYANKVKEHCKIHAKPENKADSLSDEKLSGEESDSCKEQASGQLDP